ncbi:MAG: AAA family ATPase [Bacteroidales bacterium]|nr:AAA family ATPase [Bacteroidales bacterium]
MPNKILKIFFNDYEKMFLKFNGDFFKQQYMENIQQCIILIQGKKNLILQGAPGTGKTYNTAALALSICGVKNGDIFNVSENGKDTPYTMDFSNHSVVMKRYEQLSYDSKNNPNGQIAFCTFHQSMDYEDFIEGIKPKTENGIISYNVEDGIFKILSTNANKITTEKKSSKIDFKKTRIFKMSLGKKGKDDEEIFSYCFENNVVALGWGENKDFSDCRTQKDFIAKYVNDSINKWGAVAMEIFKQQMKKGDIILVSNGTKAVKAIAKVVGEYEFHDDAPIDMCQFRKVEWLYTGEPIPITKLYNKNLSQQSIYAFYDSAKEGKIDFNSIKTNILNDIITGEINNETPQNYVLIIDEINRGNVSKIFGELITLLEADKRLGGEHPIKVTLPYSKDEFGVPSNLYIIGTMNTTDRSVGNIDYAVRRRFAFVTLKSKREIVEDKWGTDDCNAVKLFDAVKSFIEKKKYDMDIEDLMVGHSYFMANDDSELELKWKYEILPLLNEYIKDGILKGDAIKTDKTIDNFISENPNA